MLTVRPSSIRGSDSGFFVMIVLLAMTCSPAIANPIVDPMYQTGQGFRISLTMIALMVEIAISVGLLKWICKTESWLPLVVGLILLNIGTFYLFVVWLQPKIQNILVVETLIWFTESLGIVCIARLLGSTALSLPKALGVAFFGNLVSFLVGSAV